MSRREKKFDAVEMMRSIRDRVSAEIEELEWLASQKLDDPFLERLRATAQPTARARRTARVP